MRQDLRCGGAVALDSDGAGTRLLAQRLGRENFSQSCQYCRKGTTSMSSWA